MAKLADDSKRSLGGKLVADRDGGCDVLTGRAEEVPEGGGHCRHRHQLMDPAAGLGGFLTRSAILRYERVVSSVG